MLDMSMVQKAAVYILLISVYGFTYLAALLGGIIPRRAWKPTGRIMVTGTFHNPGWYLSHVRPLARSGVKEVILVVDKPQLALERVKFVCPPRWLSRLLSRAVAKAIWMIAAGFRYRPDLYMGYYIVPGACTALVAGKLLGRPSCYQMTGGPIEIIGGGYNAGDNIGRMLGRPSKLIEALAVAVVRQFDLVVVRGDKARRFLATYNIKRSVVIITGSVNRCLQSLPLDRGTDLICVGRLAPTKQVDQFIKIVCEVSRIMPSVRAMIVGDGPLMADLRAYTEDLGLTNNIEFLGKRKDVESLLVRSKVFVLTSRSEGLSIALAEAMSAGVVPVVADVGELSDLVIDGVNGYLVEPNQINEYTEKVLSLLQDHRLWEKLSSNAADAARSHCDIEVVTRKWQRCLQEVIAHAGQVAGKEIFN